MKTKSYACLMIFTLVLFSGITFIPNAQALTTYVENFDTEVPPELPTEDWYTLANSGTGIFRTTSAQSNSAPNSYAISVGSTTSISATFTFDAHIDLCGVGQLEVAFRFSELPDGVGDFQILRAGTIADAFATITVDGAGVTKLFTNAQSITMLTVVANQWYEIVWDFESASGSCAPGQVQKRSSVYWPLTDEGPFEVTSVTTGQSTTVKTFRFLYIDDTASTGTIFIDDLALVNAQDQPPPTINAVQSDLFANIIGFAVTDNGENVVIRRDNGDTVTTLSGATLTTIASEDTDCIKPGQVMAQFHEAGTIIGYVDCEAGTNNPESLRLKSVTFGTPSGSAFAQCESDNPVDDRTGCSEISLAEFPADEGAGSPETIEDMANIPLDWSVTSGLGDVIENIYKISWVGIGGTKPDSTQDKRGKLLAYVYNAITFADDDATSAEVDLGAGGGNSLDDMCAGITNAGQAYVGGADLDVNSKVYQLTYFNETPSPGSGPRIHVSIGSPDTYNPANAIGCRDNMRVLANSVSQQIWTQRFGTAQVIAGPFACSCQAKSVSISAARGGNETQDPNNPTGTGRYVAYATSATTWSVVHAGNFTAVATGTVPVQITDLELTRFANKLYATSSTRVFVFPIDTVIGSVSESTGTTGTIPPTAEEEFESGSFGETSGILGAFFGGGAALGDAIIGLAIVALCFSLGALVLVKKAPLIGAISLGGIAFAIFALNGTFHPSVSGTVLILVGGLVYLTKR